MSKGAASPRVPRIGRMLAVTAIAAALTACETLPDTQIAKTATALGRVENTFRDSYETLNSKRREAYVRSQVFRGQPIDVTKPAMKGSIYPTAAVEARLTALDAVARYAELLDAYANGGQAQAVGDAASGFTESAFALQGRVANPGAEASKYAEPVSKLVGLVATWIVDAQLKKGLKQELPRATAEINNILDLLAQDADLLESRAVVDTANEYTALVGFYNTNAAALPLSDRERIATLIVDAAEARDAAADLDLAKVVASAKKAVTALNKRIQDGASPDDIKAATEALAEFNSRVRALDEVVEALKKARKG